MADGPNNGRSYDRTRAKARQARGRLTREAAGINPVFKDTESYRYGANRDRFEDVGDAIKTKLRHYSERSEEARKRAGIKK